MPIAATLPDGFRELQVRGALEIYDRRRLLLADQPGSGKTLQALLALELDGEFTEPHRCTLILCNVTGCQLTWGPEIRRRVVSQYPDVVFCDLTDTGGAKTMPSVATRNARLVQAAMHADETGAPLVVLANYNLLHYKAVKDGGYAAPAMGTIDWNAIVVDESHLVLPDANSDPKKFTQFTHGILRLRHPADVILLAMTGTPDRGHLENRFGTWRWFMPNRYTDYWAWARSNFVLNKIDVGWDPRLKRPRTATVVGKLKSTQAWDMFSQQFMLRRTKAEMLVGLPEKQWANEGAVDLPMTPAQKAAYDRFLDALEREEAELREAGEIAAAEGLRLQATIRGRQLATLGSWDFVTDDEGHTHGKPLQGGQEASNKLAWLVNEFLEPRGYLPDNYDASLGKVVIVSYLTEVLGWLQKELADLGVRAEILSGDTSSPDKTRIQQAFQAGDLRIVLLSGHLGIAIDLDAADDMVFVDMVHDPDRIEQAEDRIHRASRFHQTTFWRLVSQDTVDEAIIEKVDKRYWMTRERYDGSRGVQFARRMLPKGAI